MNDIEVLVRAVIELRGALGECIQVLAGNPFYSDDTKADVLRRATAVNLKTHRVDARYNALVLDGEAAARAAEILRRRGRV